ncbi:hypothetical protein COW36_11065 [bacterium (Candidatus Blackallbacteria) CG17_big_fil_post_rev_8_21_14_2_50_48_46]|uniref:N-acetyltransferase domain-containing protein n=1 Tax=bacterium (Candidatus Blackallbacteria) CG17_big_fil_post_rev_8_21_14_2_50_48_46 TaxID=2014261 RepID=A0A2M7G4H0_9BACT|nr:MAG: hypothetical protein COW64_18160 [bacterium (Candidatus Blackallbacteria) CG18_big_fil_WC_8_21_14_2_50_49_26]PIW16815.1 MAG: hypothetical protein COW36_11065 [bacterium (Candidatus Blackallbacteria) CG17_big_fil_post_rev_8_21_14_2_50_48_46]PIW48012.1 MAG: hypothetical protein COW20_10780 [bacterium (Candidatus Blackallbacteria) CG13_big_fil_rev_8_21_14_2_50_49_14]
MEKLRVSCLSENIAPLVEFCCFWAQGHGLSAKEAERWSLALDELLTNIVLFGFQESDSPEDLEIQFQVHPTALEIIILEKGEPFEPKFHPYHPEAVIQNHHFEGSGLHLIQAFSDDFHFFNKGRSGKEFRLLKNLSPHVFKSQPLLPESQVQDLLSSESLIRQVLPSDAESISRLIFRTYGHTYPKEELYYPQKIAQALRQKQKFGVLCQQPNGLAIGYFAVLKMKDSAIGEVAEAVVSTAYRGQGLMTRMMQELLELSKSKGLKGVFAEAITMHTASQRVNSRFKFVSTALLLNAFPGVQSKGFNGVQKERLSVLIEYFPFEIPSLRKVYLPKHFRKILLEIYHQLGFILQEEKVPASLESCLASETQFEAVLGYKFQNALLVLTQCGADLKSCLKKQVEYLLQKGFLTLQIDLPLEAPWTPWATQELQGLGFFFAGLFPLAHAESDYLRLQKCHCQPPLKQIHLYSDLALKIRKKVALEFKKWNCN